MLDSDHNDICNIMADKKFGSPNANKTAMSRALGAAFLNHQVEQLEKSVNGQGPASGNWRERRAQSNGQQLQGAVAPRQGATSPGSKDSQPRRKGADRARDGETDRFSATQTSPTRRSGEEDRRAADIIVVDASVLIHALYQVKRWCRDGRDEIIVVPLEALNTLDLLKKGTSSVAQRARAASRILEAQVGSNPRIRVQHDNAYVPWDKISFNDGSATPPPACPEWVRRIICCARWEIENPEQELKGTGRNSHDEPSNTAKPDSKYKVVLAVLSSSPSLSPQSMSLKLADMSISNHDALNPVPLPAPTLHNSRHEARSNGSLVAHWAAKATINLMEVEPSMPGRGEDEDRPRRGANKNRRPSSGDPGRKPGLVERPPAVMAMMEMISQPTKVVRVLARGEKLDLGP